VKKQLHQDVYIGFVCLALSLMIFVLNNNLPSDAAIMPRLLGGMMMVLSLIIIGHGLQKSKLPIESQGAKALSVDAMKIPLITWGMVVLYYILFAAIGYILSTGIMIVVLMRFMKSTSWFVVITIDIIYLLLVYFVFARMLNVPIDGFGMLSQLL